MINFFEPKIDTANTLKYLGMVLKSNFPNENNLTKKLSSKLKKKLNVKYASLINNGTASLYCALKILNLKKNDEVIIPNITFQATANSVVNAGLKVVFVKVEKDNLLIDINDLEKKITKKTKVIIPVHVSGKGSNIKKIIDIAKKKKIFVIEDAAEALFSKYQNKFLGTFGDIGCFSFAPNKIITTGQGGLIITNNKILYRRIKSFQDQGRSYSNKRIHTSVGFNFKFTDLQAALGLSQLKDINLRIQQRKINYLLYKSNLSNNSYIKLKNFNIKDGELPLWVEAKCKKAYLLINFLKENKIQCRNLWKPVNETKPFKKKIINNFNIKEYIWLPSCHSLSKKRILFICKKINAFYEKN